MAAMLSGIVLLIVPALLAAQDLPGPRREAVFACEYDTSDDILGHICRRAGADTARLGYALGFDVEVRAPNSVGGAAWAMGEGFVQLVLRIDADRPPGMFDTKTVHCSLAGTRVPRRLAPNGEIDPADFQASFEAAGVARDLVHPVADAVADLVDDYFTRVSTAAR
jgi:hypothetical protein